jgi:hypothetical protein
MNLPAASVAVPTARPRHVDTVGTATRAAGTSALGRPAVFFLGCRGATVLRDRSADRLGAPAIRG